MVGSRWMVGGLACAMAFVVAVGNGASAQATRSAQGEIVILEVQYDPAPSGSESAFEWVELHNPGGESISLAGWTISDNRAEDPLPELAVAPGGYLIVAGPRFAELYPSYDGPLATLSTIGNGLGNGGDRLRLRDGTGREVDAMSYGDDADAFDPPAPLVAAGHSLERASAGGDTDTAADWVEREHPSPGAHGEGDGPSAPPATAPPEGTSPAPSAEPATPTVGAVGTPVPEGVVRINEHLPAPSDIDWDGDGEATSRDEWIELYNAGPNPIDLRGWQVDDVADGGSSPYVLPDGAVIAARGRLLLFRSATGIALNNGGDAVRLIRPDGLEVDRHEYDTAGRDASWARVTDGATAWVDDLPPSPGAPNGGAAVDGTATPPAPPATPDPGASATPPVASPSATAPPPPPGGTTPGPGVTPPVPTPSPDAGGPPRGAVFLPLLLSEVLYDAAEDGNDAAQEWVEIHNPGTRPVSLTGWAVGDRRTWDALGDAVVPPRGFVVIAASEGLSRTLGAGTGRVGGARIAVVADVRIGGGLGNGGDIVRLRGPTGDIVDAVGWGSAREAFDPAAPIGPPGASLVRHPVDRDTNTADDWWPTDRPSPGEAGAAPGHLGTAPLRINEVLPAPRYVDWDGNGEASHEDEWIELHHAGAIPVALRGWRLEVGDPPRWDVSLPLPDGATRIQPGGMLLLPRSATGLHLANDGDTLRLRRPDGVVADRFTWTASPGPDRSWSRRADGERAAGWTEHYAATPGRTNRPLGDGERRRADIAAADAARRRARAWPTRPPRADPIVLAVALADVRTLGRRTRVVVRGRVTAPPGTFGPREMMLGDEHGGVRLYLRRKTESFRPFILGDPVAAIGVLSDYRGERQVTVDAEDVWWDGEGGPLPPAELATGAIGDATEGRLVRIAGRATGFGGPRITIDDGSGPARIVWRTSTGLERPWVARGAWLRVTGIAGQSDGKAPYAEGYRVVPRFAEDVETGVPAGGLGRRGGDAIGRAGGTGGGAAVGGDGLWAASVTRGSRPRGGYGSGAFGGRACSGVRAHPRSASRCA